MVDGFEFEPTAVTPCEWAPECTYVISASISMFLCAVRDSSATLSCVCVALSEIQVYELIAGSMTRHAQTPGPVVGGHSSFMKEEL